MVVLLEEAASKDIKIILFPDIAFNTFLPRFLCTDFAELDRFFEHGEDLTKSPNLAPLLSWASQLRVDVQVRFAERTSEGKGFNHPKSRLVL